MARREPNFSFRNYIDCILGKCECAQMFFGGPEEEEEPEDPDAVREPTEEDVAPICDPRELVPLHLPSFEQCQVI